MTDAADRHDLPGAADPSTPVDAADGFGAHRDRLFGVAYRLLGEVAAAQDAVQEAWLRWERADREAVREPAAWLTTVVSRICLDQLRSARARREVYVGPWLPEPLVGVGAGADPADGAVLRESLTQAFLVVLEALSPAERVAFVLREVFEHDHATIADVLGMQEPAVRQLVSRARKAVEARRTRFAPDEGDGRAVADAFLVSCAMGEVEHLLTLLAPDVVFTSDGGGRVLAVRVPVVGADEVVRTLTGLLRFPTAGLTLERVEVNAMPGFVVRRADGAPETVFSIHVADGVVRAVHAVRNPEKLAHVPPAGPEAVELDGLLPGEP